MTNQPDPNEVLKAFRPSWVEIELGRLILQDMMDKIDAEILSKDNK